MKNFLARLYSCKAASLLEACLLVALITIVVLGSVHSMGGGLSAMFASAPCKMLEAEGGGSQSSMPCDSVSNPGYLRPD